MDEANGQGLKGLLALEQKDQIFPLCIKPLFVAFVWAEQDGMETMWGDSQIFFCPVSLMSFGTKSSSVSEHALSNQMYKSKLVELMMTEIR